MKTVITKRYNYKELRAKGQPCSVIQEYDFQGAKVNFVPQPVEGCRIEQVKASPSMYNTDRRWVKDLTAYETLQLISELDEPVKYHKKYYENEGYAWLEVINEDDDYFSSI